MAGDSLMGPPALFHRSLADETVTGETDQVRIVMHTDPSQCHAHCPKGWLAAYPGNSPRDYIDFDTGELTDYAGHVDAMQRRATARLQRRDVTDRPQLNVKYRGFTMFRCDACGEDYLSIDSARDCRDSHTRGRVGSISPEVRSTGSVGDAGSSPAASTGPARKPQTSELRASEDAGNQSPAELALRIIDTLVPHLEAKLARVTGRPIEWRFGHLRAALDVLRVSDTPVTKGDVVGRGGHGIVLGSQHGRDCTDESCRTPVPGRHALGEGDKWDGLVAHDEAADAKNRERARLSDERRTERMKHHCGIEEAPFAKFTAFELAALDAVAGPFAEDERDAFFFGA